MKVVMRPNQNAPGNLGNFVQAVLALKAEKRGDTNTYDQYVREHRDTMPTHHAMGEDSGYAHSGPAFFPWHRQFLIEFERDLQRVSGNPLLGLPYWDWSVDQSAAPDTGRYAPQWPFTEYYLGGNGRDSDGKVMDGEFAYDKGRWPLNIRIEAEEPTNYLRRQFGSDPDANSLPTQKDVQDTLNATPYDVDPWNDRSQSGFRNIAEGWIGGRPSQQPPPPQPPPPQPPPPQPHMHNRVHVWVGGSMGPMTSPNDPVFFLHHCFVDKLWADWQRRHQKDVGYQPYLPTNGARNGHNLGDYMPPWNTAARQMIRPLDVLDHRKLGYRYETENYLLSGEELYQGQWIWSANKKYSILYGDQERVLWLAPTSGGKVLWQSATTNQPPGRCIMRADGNLVIYHIDVPYPHGKGDPYEPNPIWESKTSGNPGSSLLVSDEGNLELYRPGTSAPFWRNGKLLP